jgi:hypothetical protein
MAKFQRVVSILKSVAPTMIQQAIEGVIKSWMAPVNGSKCSSHGSAIKRSNSLFAKLSIKILPPYLQRRSCIEHIISPPVRT